MGFGRYYGLFTSLVLTCLWGPSSGQVKCYYVQHTVLTHFRLFDRARRLPLEIYNIYVYI